MIVFWRLLLAYYVAAVLLYNVRFFTWRNRHPYAAATVEGTVFWLLATVSCGPFLQMDWPVAELWPVSGWLAVTGLSVFYVLINKLFVYRTGQQKGHSITFLLHDGMMLAGILAVSPLHTLYHTGNWMAEPVTVFCVGALVVSKMLSVFIYMVELDLYQRDALTIDERFLTMLMRLIFFLIMLLPGWRWVVWVVIWLWVCGQARRSRLMDLSSFAFYFGAFSSCVMGFLVRWAWYLHL